MVGSYRRVTGGLKEFEHTGYDLPDTASTKEFKKVYQEWRKFSHKPNSQEFRELQKRLERLIDQQDDRQLECAWLSKENARLQKHCTALEREIAVNPGRLSVTRYVSLHTVVIILLLLAVAWLWFVH